MKDLYKILGVAEDADAETIKKTYRKLAKENHPDATGGDKKKTERFKEIGEAYGVLGDEAKRRQGGRPPSGGQPGDLLLEIVVTPDPHLRREEGDIVLDLPLTFAEAALGTKVDVPTVDGPVRLTIPAGTSSEAKLRLRGKGIKHP